MCLPNAIWRSGVQNDDMTDADAFQSLKPHYFAWLDATALARPALLARLQSDMAPADFVALKRLISQTELDSFMLVEQEAPRSRIGEQYGAFVIRSKLGSGGMGEVFLAERVSGGFQQTVALKLMRHEFAPQSFLKRFDRERDILARLSHPNIAGLIDGGLQGGVPWFAMAYVDGELLTHVMRRGTLTTAEKLALARQIAEALTQAHRKLVIHRDLKPSNVMLDAQGKVKLLDFGIGKLLDDSDGGETLSGLTPMTLRYASPEQLSGEPTSTSTDIYQLGLLLSEMLLGAPTRDESALASARHLPQDLRAVLRQALAQQPTERYASASDFAADLRRLLQGEPVSAMPARWRYRLQRFVTRNRALTAALLFSAAAMVAGIYSSLWQARQAQRNASTVLQLLNVAAPQDYGKRAPELVAYLQNSAAQLEQALVDQPEFLAQSLTQIGNGLINLGDEPAAQTVLVRAHAAALRAGFSAEREFSILRLLAYSMEPPTPLDKAQALSVLITEKLSTAPNGEGLNALASISNTLSKHGDAKSVAANLAHIEKLLPTLAQSDLSQENILRQLGKIALREQNAAQAQRYFLRANALYQAQPRHYSAMRIAEGQAFLAQAALAAGDIAQAKQAWRQAQAQFEQNYRPENTAMQEFVVLGQAIAQAQTDRRTP
jgi:eukaryotic-like serine/threonine-protein kinase